MTRAPRPTPDIQVLERGWLSSNVIVLGGDPRGALVVDSGYCTHAEQTAALIAAALAEDQSVAGQLRLIINTHLHSDHCGGNALIQAQYGCPIWVPPGDFEAASTWDEARLSFGLTGQKCTPFQPSAILHPGDYIEQGKRHWQVHAAPGHDPHAILLFEPEGRILISADALWEHGFGIVFPEIDGLDAFADVGASLNLIESLSPTKVIPGHGAPFCTVQEALAEAREKLAYFQRHPDRHARHGAKALIIFHMLEKRSVQTDELRSWLLATPIHRQIHRKFFAAESIEHWTNELLNELEKGGKLRPEGNGERISIA